MPTNQDQDFSAQNLNWMRRWRSQSHLVSKETENLPSGKAEWASLLQSVSDQIKSDGFKFDGMHTSKIKENVVLTTKYIEEALVLRKINDNIRRTYGISQPNRQSLVRSAKQAISENCPKTIVRVDLKKCFESINRRWVIDRLRSDGLVTYQTLTLIDKLFNFSSSLSPSITPFGLPRGIILSTTLAEIKLRELDSRIQRINGVYLLIRYVDDLLVFTTENKEKAFKDITDSIKSLNLNYNPQKTRTPVRVACLCETSCVHANKNVCSCKKKCTCHTNNPSPTSFTEYLGYKFMFSPHNSSNTSNANTVHCVLSDRKIQRIKTRIHMAFLAFRDDKNPVLLAKRMEYLSSNQAIRKSAENKYLFNGLAFTHAEYSPPPDKQGKGNLISDIDHFYQAKLRLHKKTIPKTSYSRLLKISFTSGFYLKRRTKFSGLEIHQIRKCWG